MRLKKKKTKTMLSTKVDSEILKKAKSYAETHGFFLCDLIEKGLEHVCRETKETKN